jgi:hypothetical protein
MVYTVVSCEMLTFRAMSLEMMKVVALYQPNCKDNALFLDTESLITGIIYVAS